jgi:hypothetical protein
VLRQRPPNELLFDARAASCGNAPLRSNSRQGSTFCHRKLLVSLCAAEIALRGQRHVALSRLGLGSPAGLAGTRRLKLC